VVRLPLDSLSRSRDTVQISHGKFDHFHRTLAEFTPADFDSYGLCHHLLARPIYIRLISNFYTSSRDFARRFLQTQPRDYALALCYSSPLSGSVWTFASSYQTCVAHKHENPEFTLGVLSISYNGTSYFSLLCKVNSMCLAIPGKIIEFADETKHVATVDFSGVRRSVNIDLVRELGIEIGDWVLIHVGFALSKISEEQAVEQIELLNMLGEAQTSIEEMRGYSLADT
jgi:hydrogenase expression/formation protein HypC